jgi:monovalent cation:H+ antiporter, CPA1 family
MYKELLANTQHKMAALIQKNAGLLHQLNLSSAAMSLHAVQLEALDNLHKNEIISDKLYIMLHHEIVNKKSS